MTKNILCERSAEPGELHIYINSDEFTNGNNTLVASFDGKEFAYSIDLKETNPEEAIDWFMGLVGRDTQNWFHKDIIIHWGVHTWKFYNAKNISDFTKEEYDEFGIDRNDYDNLH